MLCAVIFAQHMSKFVETWFESHAATSRHHVTSVLIKQPDPAGYSTLHEITYMLIHYTYSYAITKGLLSNCHAQCFIFCLIMKQKITLKILIINLEKAHHCN